MHSRKQKRIALGFIAAATIACGRDVASERPQTRVAASPTAAGAIVNPAPDPDEGSWVRAAKDYASWRYSSLAEITTENVSQLTPAWTFSTGVLRGQEAFPLVAENTMYVVTPFPNILYALDLARPGAPVKWKYEPKPAAAAQE